MKRRSEEEHEPGRIEDPRSLRRLQVERGAAGFEHIGASRDRGDAPVAVLGHRPAGGRHHERRGGRDVESPALVAAGPAGVHQRPDLGNDRLAVVPHRAGAGGQGGGIGFGDPERDEQSGGLGHIAVAGEDAVQRGLERTGIGRATGEERFKQRGNQGWAPSAGKKMRFDGPNREGGSGERGAPAGDTRHSAKDWIPRRTGFGDAPESGRFPPDVRE